MCIVQFNIIELALDQLNIGEHTLCWSDSVKVIVNDSTFSIEYQFDHSSIVNFEE